MKSLTAVCQTGASMPPINPNGRIARHPHQRGDGENAEMKMYLSKLKDLVPFMPKNRKLSKLEIIQHVIDYICDLQTELETHPDIGNFDAASALNLAASGSDAHDDDEAGEDMLTERLAAEEQHQLQLHQQQQQQQHSSPATRQPLVDRQAPNTILPASGHSLAPNAAQMQQQLQQLQQQQQQQQQQQLREQTLAAVHNGETATAEKDSRQTAC